MYVRKRSVFHCVVLKNCVANLFKKYQNEAHKIINFAMIRSNSSFPLQVLIKKAKFLMFQKELPLVAFLEQETFAFFTPGFPLQSGLDIPITINIFLFNFYVTLIT
ncbi:hypothetical protein EAH81_05430 [Flavobacterium pectinovorum]|uniref:Uncharacterized protein n=1 Tax=Flavobacterium pectinovorum TaxID=29533 RepID=A0A502F3M8_9FLAO|nr:hypothetical protein EAH81_05430 [Flavobacterium pectinovorum]